jgi:hypothetical protein
MKDKILSKLLDIPLWILDKAIAVVLWIGRKTNR